MISPSVVYPPSPTEDRGVLKETSVSFRKEVGKVLTSIILFFIVYVLLICLAVILAILTVYGGVALILAAPKFITLMIGLGLIGLGIMVLFFLIKFIFAVSKFDHSNSIEVKETEQPALFAFIRKLSHETQTSFPKKIYISPEVNACVFYDSSFWSMMLPVKKNLQIGLGVVNVLTVSEFKAVVAHEFGHFSQRSMKLGSFVYNVNKVIYNMLYHNSGYGNTLNVWANIHGLFAVFAALTVRIVRCIQWILQGMYALINKNYMALSREMEFHADAVAASVSGSDSLITALRRLDLADASYNMVLSKYNDLFKEKLVADNMYHDHQTVMHLVAKEHRLEIKDNITIVNEKFLKERVQNRVNYKDQWASHPPVEERTKQLAQLNIAAEQNNESAWTLFTDRDSLQQQLTKKIYAEIPIPEEATIVDAATFQSKYLQEQEAYRLPSIFNGFFDDREISEFDLNKLIKERSKDNSTVLWSGLFGCENLSLPKRIVGLKSDIDILENIETGYFNVKSFDFDGQKYDAKESACIKEKLEVELKAAEQKQSDLDHDMVWYFYDLARQHSTRSAYDCKQQLQLYNELRHETASFLTQVNNTIELIAPFYSDENLTYETVNAIVTELKSVKEPAFKISIRHWLGICDFSDNLVLKEKALNFIEKDYHYFVDNSFMNNELEEYNFLLREMWMVVSFYKFRFFKKLLNDRISLLPDQLVNVKLLQADI
ncbi:M48 family metalloprotease [Flavitalea sp.]|nr:M48 family metallopeptidase [Flavitalea sp.]